jgi:hypothetical protein
MHEAIASGVNRLSDSSGAFRVGILLNGSGDSKYSGMALRLLHHH